MEAKANDGNNQKEQKIETNKQTFWKARIKEKEGERKKERKRSLKEIQNRTKGATENFVEF